MSQLLFYEKVSEVLSELKIDNSFTVIDQNVAQLYKDALIGNYFVFDANEKNKSLSLVQKISSAMLNAGCNRKTTLIAIGGGITGDIAGFTASAYMRGIKYINVPTTLLAQIDSSIGGKTGCNLGGVKNIVGAFHKPEKVLICREFLQSLPCREWLCGIGEIVKSAFLSEELYQQIENELDNVYNFNCKTELIKKLAEFKLDVTEKDPTEQGLRKILNLGHTVGHALEKFDCHTRSHGEYVLHGLLIESFITRAQAPLYYEKVRQFIDKLNLEPLCFNARTVAKLTLKDKKNNDGIIVMYPKAIGNVCEIKFSYSEMVSGLTEWRKNN